MNTPTLSGIFHWQGQDFSWQIFVRECAVIINPWKGLTFSCPQTVTDLSFEDGNFRNKLDWMAKDFRSEYKPGEYVLHVKDYVNGGWTIAGRIWAHND